MDLHHRTTTLAVRNELDRRLIDFMDLHNNNTAIVPSARSESLLTPGRSKKEFFHSHNSFKIHLLPMGVLCVWQSCAG